MLHVDVFFEHVNDKVSDRHTLLFNTSCNYPLFTNCSFFANRSPYHINFDLLKLNCTQQVTNSQAHQVQNHDQHVSDRSFEVDHDLPQGLKMGFEKRQKIYECK